MAQRNHAEYDSFICCILTHGEQNIVHGADSIPVSVLDLMGVMKMCKILVNKPKVFFIQADRGEQEDKGHRLDNKEATQQQDSVSKQPLYTQAHHPSGGGFLLWLCHSPWQCSLSKPSPWFLVHLRAV